MTEVLIALELLELAALAGTAAWLVRGGRRPGAEAPAAEEDDDGEDARLRAGIVNLLCYSAGEKKEEE